MDFIHLFFLAIPLVASHNTLQRIVVAYRRRKVAPTPFSFYLFNACIAIAAFLFAYYYYGAASSR